MKTSRLLLSVFAAFGVAAFVHGQATQPAPKSPADLAAEEFFKLCETRNVKLDEARLDKLLATGIAFLKTSPEHAKAPMVVSALGNFGGTMADPKLSAYRILYAGKLSFALIDFRSETDLTPAGRTARGALDAAARDAEARADLTRENLRALREKIDDLTRLPESGRFLVEREDSYVELVTKSQGVPATERHLKRLLEHPEGAVAAMARSRLNFIEVRKAPYELKFTALDGKEFDVSKWRGKVVGIVFWSTANQDSVKALDGLKALHTKYKSNGFEVLSVSFDKAEDREKVAKVVADKKLSWPVHFDGNAEKNEWVSKLNVRGVPQLAVFDQKGMLQTSDVAMDRFEAGLKAALGVKDADPEPEMGAGKKRGR